MWGVVGGGVMETMTVPTNCKTPQTVGGWTKCNCLPKPLGGPRFTHATCLPLPLSSLSLSLSQDPPNRSLPPTFFPGNRAIARNVDMRSRGPCPLLSLPAKHLVPIMKQRPAISNITSPGPARATGPVFAAPI